MPRAINQQPASSGFLQRLFAPIDIASLAAFRMLFGAAMLVDMCFYTREKIVYHWLEPKFLFKYYGFEWVHVLPGDGMVYLVWALRALAAMVMLGLLYRPAIALFFVGFTYTFLVDQAEHLNHSYLICLVSFLMMFIPAHRAGSIDAWLRPGLRSNVAPAWTAWILRFQIGVVYFFGGLAKLNADWFQGEPVRTWLAGRAHYPVVGHLFTSEVTVAFFAYGGMAFDLLVAPMLLFRRTRPWILPALIFFHIANAWLFDIGIFPWLMLAATTIFFEPDWPRRLWRRLAGRGSRVEGKNNPPPTPDPRPSQRLVAGLLLVYALVQVAAPLRHAAYPGNVNWTEEGHRFSWRMKLRSKFGSAHFFVTDRDTRRTWLVDPRSFVNPIQAMRMSARPDMVQQMAKFIAADARTRGHTNVEVRARDLLSLNGRRPQLLIDPDVDLAAQPRSLRHATWILPLTQPLPPRGKPLYSPEERALVVEKLQERRDLQHILVSLARMIDEQAASLRNVDADLQRRFGVDAASDYRFDADQNRLFRREPAGDVEVAHLTNAPDRRAFMELAGHRATLRREVAGLQAIEAEKLEAERKLYDVLDRDGTQEEQVD